MKVVDVKEMKVYPLEEKRKNIFYEANEFKARVVELPPGGEIPECKMSAYVIFYVVKGTAEITVNGEKVNLKEGQCLITEPTTLSMKTKDGVRIMGIIIIKH